MAHQRALVGLLLAILVASTATARSLPTPRASEETTAIRRGGPPPGSAKAAADTFYLYGGPGTVQGRFQTLLEGGAPDPQGWATVDRTDITPHWHAAQTNAEGLGGAGNWAAISHHEGEDYVGYGNDWVDALRFELDLAAVLPGFDPSTDTTTVSLSLDFDAYLELNYDFVRIQRWNGESWTNLFTFTGKTWNDGSWDSPHFASGPWEQHPGTYAPGGLLQLQIVVDTDPIASDQDGEFATGGRGAVAVDGIEVRVEGEVVSFADFEPLEGATQDQPEGSVEGHDCGAGVGTDGWLPTAAVAGDFAKIFSGLSEPDPCGKNPSPQFTFIDDGTPPANRPSQSTGGSTSSRWSYGTPGGWVVNYDGGLSEGTTDLHNEIWSPAFAFDLPGSADQVANGGVFLRYRSWQHARVADGIFALWHVRSWMAGEGWGPWVDHGFLGYTSQPVYQTIRHEIGGLVPAGAESLQVALGVRDFARDLRFVSEDATPSPWYDDVAVAKYRIGGPAIEAYEGYVLQGGFPADGTLTGPVRLDMASPVTDPGDPTLLPGDSMVVTIRPLVPGTALSDPLHGGVLRVAHLANPFFEAARQTALTQLGASVLGDDPDTGWTVYGYQVPGERIPDGLYGDDRFAFDLPDGPAHPDALHQSDEPALFFPGDRIHWYVEAGDDGGNLSRLPAEIEGFGDFGEASPFDPAHVLRALPGLDGAGTQRTSILFWNDFGHLAEAESAWRAALQHAGLREGFDYDIYTSVAAGAELANGLGAAGAHGATPGQVEGYDTLLYDAGRLEGTLLGEDDPSGPRGDDLGLLRAWHLQNAPRRHVYLGTGFASSLAQQGTGAASFLQDVLGTQSQGGDVAFLIDDQHEPTLLGQPPHFALPYDLAGGCPEFATYDHVVPAGAAVSSHDFLDPSGAAYLPSVSAGIRWERTEGGHAKVTQLHPFDLLSVAPAEGVAYTFPTRSRFLCETLDALGLNGSCTGAAAPPAPAVRFALAQNHPNPFNPRTVIELTAPRRGDLRLRVYDLKGRLVKVLHAGEIAAGDHRFVWDGTDDAGRQVASGVYLYRAQGFGRIEVRKMALLR